MGYHSRVPFNTQIAKKHDMHTLPFHRRLEISTQQKKVTKSIMEIENDPFLIYKSNKNYQHDITSWPLPI